MSKKDKGKQKAPAEAPPSKSSSQGSGSNSLVVNIASDRASSDSSTADRSAAFPGEPRARLRTSNFHLPSSANAVAHVTTTAAPYPTPVSFHTGYTMPIGHRSSMPPPASSAPVSSHAQTMSANMTATAAAGYSFVPAPTSSGATFSGHGLSSSRSGGAMTPGHRMATAPIPIPGVTHHHSSSTGGSSSGGHPNTHPYAGGNSSGQSHRTRVSGRASSSIFQFDMGSSEEHGPQQTQQAPTPYDQLRFPLYYGGAYASSSARVAGPSGHGTAQYHASTSRPRLQATANGMRNCSHCGEPMVASDGHLHQCGERKRRRY